jgi:chemotaxis protein CheD
VVTETIMPVDKFVFVGMGEMQVAHSPNTVLSCIGLGSCIGISAYDRVLKIGGMVHVVLPKYDGKDRNQSKYADTAVPLLLDEIVAKGGSKSHLIVKIAGGAQMSLAPGLETTFKTGERNLAEVLRSLEKEGVRVAASDTGGNKGRNKGRTIRTYLDTGRVTVKVVGGEEKEL